MTVGTNKVESIRCRLEEIQQGGTGDWIRPADWLELIDLFWRANKGSRVICYLSNVTLMGMTNTVAFVVTGNYTVDWGDGVVENFNSNVV